MLIIEHELCVIDITNFIKINKIPKSLHLDDEVIDHDQSGQVGEVNAFASVETLCKVSIPGITSGGLVNDFIEALFKHQTDTYHPRDQHEKDYADVQVMSLCEAFLILTEHIADPT